MNDYDNALKQVENSRRISKNINDFSSLIEIDFIHGKILLSMHKENQAIKLFKSVLQRANVKRHQIINPKYRATFVANLENCRNLLVETLVSESLKNNDKSLVLEALMVSESGKAKSLNDLMHQTKTETIGNNKYIALQNQLQTLYYLKSDLQDKPHFKEVEASRINHEIQEVLFKLDVLQESNGYGQSKNGINKNRIKQLQETMDDKSLFVALRLTSNQSFIWHISKDKITVKALPQKELIENNVRILYEFFKASPYGLKRFPLKINQSLAWMIDEVFSGVDFSNIEKFVISPHGAMQLFPLNLLYNSNRKLSPRLKISYTPSLMMEKRGGNTKNHSSKLLVIADPKFSNLIESVKNENISIFRGSTFEELKFTLDEAKHIVNLYGEDNVDLLHGRQSTKEKVLLIIQNQYKILHFATHGLIDTEIPEMSGLVFSSNGNIDNNILTIGEIMNLQIQSNTVVLSACETAIGENVREEGLIGLSYAFLAAGANQVYATLWKIGDKSALYSIKKMYSNNHLDDIHLKIRDPFWVKYEIL
jgi:CHAT domain-containing protein